MLCRNLEYTHSLLFYFNISIEDRNACTVDASETFVKNIKSNVTILTCVLWQWHVKLKLSKHLANRFVVMGRKWANFCVVIYLHAMKTFRVPFDGDLETSTNSVYWVILYLFIMSIYSWKSFYFFGFILLCAKSTLIDLRKNTLIILPVKVFQKISILEMRSSLHQNSGLTHWAPRYWSLKI